MSLNDWTNRQELEDAALADALTSLIFYCWECFAEDEDPPSEEEADKVAREVIQVWKDRIDEL